MTLRNAIALEEEKNTLRRKLELAHQREISLEHECGELAKVNACLMDRIKEVQRRSTENAHD